MLGAAVVLAAVAAILAVLLWVAVSQIDDLRRTNEKYCEKLSEMEMKALNGPARKDKVIAEMRELIHAYDSGESIPSVNYGDDDL